MLAELRDAVAATHHDGGESVHDEPWKTRVPVLSTRAELKSLLVVPVGAGQRVRLFDFVDALMHKVQKPLPIRPRGARSQCHQVLADLHKLKTACDGETATTLKLEFAWLYMPCVLWAETYADLVDSVNPDQVKRCAEENQDHEPARKRIK